MRSRWLAGLALLGGLSVPSQAGAFCGFYVGGADTKLFNNATQVVLMREGTRTVLSMANNYQGPPSDFAMVVPVPVVLQKENVKTLSKEVFARIDKLSAPRLVEYWEQDPCREGIGLGDIGTIGRGAGAGFGSGFGRLSGAHHVEVLAEFTVGEYDIVILGADDSMALDGWLRQNGYKIPEGAEPVLRPYVAAGMKFFVAKVDTSKVTFKDGQATLSPLRFHYDSETFSLPIRLGLINAGETQDLIVDILAKKQRYEVANYPNVTIPTNLDVTEATRDQFGAFYAALFDQTLEKHPRSVVTEYAWDAGTCDPCPEPPLSPQELATLGGDVLPEPTKNAENLASSVSLGGVELQAQGGLPREVISRIVRQNLGRLRACHQQRLKEIPDLKGRVVIDFTIDKAGQVSKTNRNPKTTLKDEQALACIEKALSSFTFPTPEKPKVEVSLPLVFMPTVRSSFSSGGFVLTRLHARYSKDTLGEDLVFKEAPPITGGREFRNLERQLEAGAKEAPQNNFQGRYAVRHAWQGEIKCEKPIRGLWGGPPGGTTPASSATPATSLAFAPRGAPIAQFLPAGIPAGASSYSPPSRPPTPVASQPAPGPSAAPAAPTPSPSRCGCHLPGAPSSADGGAFALLGLLALVCQRRGRQDLSLLAR